jgi:hypothetical protein
VIADPDLFNDESLGFSLRKAGAWQFMPPVWTPGPLAANSDDSPWGWIRPNQPFCVAQRLHDSPRHAYSTLQVTARALEIPSEEQAQTLLKMQLGVLSKHYGQFEVREASADAVVAGHRAIVIRGSFCLITHIEGEQVPVWLLTRIHVIFAPGRAFSIGMTSSLDESYYLESDFAATLASIRIT